MFKSILNVLIISWLISAASAFAFDNSKPTLLFFTAPWCKYCQVAKHDIDNDKELSETIKGYDVVFLDHDLDKDLVEGYNIKTLPTFIIFKNGKQTGRKEGYGGGARGLNKFLK